MLAVLLTLCLVVANTEYLPVVLMHGLGDSGSNPGMQSLAKSVSDKYPGLYATAVDVSDSLDSFFHLLPDQVHEFATKVRSDPKLAHGFNAVGLSQGGLIARAYVALYNDPPVHNLVSICGPQNGVGDCPRSVPGFICKLFEAEPYSAKLSFAGYWKDVKDQAKYLRESSFLADINNDRTQKNETYRTRMTSLNKYVLVEALNDTVVNPKESAQHGFFAWGDTTHTVAMRDTEAYKGDWIGLQTLDKAGKIDELSFLGEHIRFSREFWNDKILPYFDVKTE